MISYPAIIEYDSEDEAYNVSFPDLPGCFTFGETIDEAKVNAAEALSGYLESIDSRKVKIPKPSELSGDHETGTGVFWICYIAFTSRRRPRSFSIVCSNTERFCIVGLPRLLSMR